MLCKKVPDFGKTWQDKVYRLTPSYDNVKTKGKIAPNFCALLRKTELYMYIFLQDQDLSSVVSAEYGNQVKTAMTNLGKVVEGLGTI